MLYRILLLAVLGATLLLAGCPNKGGEAGGAPVVGGDTSSGDASATGG
jgi:hypothetical protein